MKTEMILKSKSVLSGSNKLNRSCSSENLPTSQSQMNIQMASHTLTIREVITFEMFILLFGLDIIDYYYLCCFKMLLMLL